MEIKVETFIMICMWLSQFPDSYLKQYLLDKDIYLILTKLMIRGRITYVLATSVIDYAKESNLA